MKFECYSSWDQLPDSANALFEQGEKDSIFFSRPWFTNLAAALDDDQAIDHAVKWVLGNDQVFLNTVGDIHLLKKVLKSAATFKSRTPEELMQSDLRKYKIIPLFTSEFSGP